MVGIIDDTSMVMDCHIGGKQFNLKVEELKMVTSSSNRGPVWFRKEAVILIRAEAHIHGKVHLQEKGWCPMRQSIQNAVISHP